MSLKKFKRPVGGMGPRESRPCILLIDDDVVDKIAIRRALDRLDHSLDVIGAESGIEGLQLLRGENRRRKIKPPMIVVLDLNMPRMGGLEFLRQLREDSELCSIVVVDKDSVIWRIVQARSNDSCVVLAEQIRQKNKQCPE